MLTGTPGVVHRRRVAVRARTVHSYRVARPINGPAIPCWGRLSVSHRLVPCRRGHKASLLYSVDDHGLWIFVVELVSLSKPMNLFPRQFPRALICGPRFMSRAMACPPPPPQKWINTGSVSPGSTSVHLHFFVSRPLLIRETERAMKLQLPSPTADRQNRYHLFKPHLDSAWDLGPFG